LVRPGGVQGEGSEELPGDRVDDADVEVLDEQEDGGSGVGSADPDVEETASLAECDLALVVDDVAADAVVVVELAAGAGSCLGQGVVDGGRGGSRRRGPAVRRGVRGGSG
jgi:hypothetical protein